MGNLVQSLYSTGPDPWDQKQMVRNGKDKTWKRDRQMVVVKIIKYNVFMLQRKIIQVQ